MLTLFACVFLAMYGIFCLEILPTVAQDTCSSHWECNLEEVCCKSVFSANLTEFQCRKRFNDTTSPTRSCYGYYCTADSDCKVLKDGQKLCCRSKRCNLCPKCMDNSDCGESQFCCIRGPSSPWYEQNQCRYTCVGLICKSNSECGDDCCRSGWCVNCSDPGCISRAECKHDQHCCRKWYDRNKMRKCKSKCIGGNCYSDEDCASFEHCGSDNYCVHTFCRRNAYCKPGFCCKNAGDYIGVCRQSCVGYSCTPDNACGPPGTCCPHGRCVHCKHLCQSSSDCFNGASCCQGASFGENNTCMSNCNKESCIITADCLTRSTWCKSGVCSYMYAKPCNYTTDCVTSDGAQYYCCINRVSGLKFCSKRCIGHQLCSYTSDCTGRNKHCSRDGICTTVSEYSWKLPKWLLGLLVALVGIIYVFGCYCRRKMRQVNDAMQTTVHSGNNHEGVLQNTDMPPNETQVSPNTRLHVPPAETREQIYYPLPPPTNNEFIEMELQVSHPETGVNNRDELSTPPPSYTLNDPLGSSGNEICTNTTDNPNIPPPPYSFDDQTVSPEPNNDPPPSYEVLQL